MAVAAAVWHMRTPNITTTVVVAIATTPILFNRAGTLNTKIKADRWIEG